MKSYKLIFLFGAAAATAFVGCTDETVVLPDVTEVPTVSPEGLDTRPYDNSWEMPDEMPILAWRGVPPESAYNTVEQYTLLKECGFNLNYTNYSNQSDLDQSLYAASETGIQLIPRWNSGFRTNPTKYVPLYDDDPALFAYFITDEPGKLSEFGTYTDQIDAIRSLGAKKPIYINLVGVGTDYEYEHWGFDGIEDYILQCVEAFDPPFISFDIYPLRQETEDSISVASKWFKGMEVYREMSLKTGKPFWAFVRCGANDHRPIPTVENMRLLANVDLAYGAQGIEYYTYWVPSETSDYACPITLDGQKTDTYDYVKQVNEEIRAVEKYFYKGTVTKVVHVTTEFEDITINYAAEGALGSLLTSREGKNYIVLVNKSYRENMSATRDGEDYDVLPGGMLLFERQ